MRLTPRQRASWLAHLFKAATQQHHRDLLRLFKPYVPPDGVIVDIGAHAGQFSKLFCRIASEGHVYAFEPSAYARSIMTAALRFNRLKNITLTPAGLSDTPGRTTLHTPLKRSSALGYGMAHLAADDRDSVTMDQPIELTTLDEFATSNGLTRLDLVKADVEGWELRALRGGEKTITRFRPTLYLEVDDLLLARAGDSPASLFQWLAGLGYRAFSTPDLKLAPQWAGPGDYLFTPAE